MTTLEPFVADVDQELEKPENQPPMVERWNRLAGTSKIL